MLVMFSWELQNLALSSPIAAMNFTSRLDDTLLINQMLSSEI